MTEHKPDFIARAHTALANPILQAAMHKARYGFVAKRQKAVDAVENFSALKAKAREVRERSLKDLDIYLAYFEKQVVAAGGHVHWASTPEDMRNIVIAICEQQQARTVTKGKTMVGEEIELNAALEARGITPVETDLGEYILQLADEKPSHIIAPALHKTRPEISTLFKDNHQRQERDLTSIKSLVDEAREVIRSRYLEADVGITGANALIAETGTTVLVTNEGNGDLTASLPNTHIVTTSIDKVVPTREDATAILRVLARSATGQSISTYTSFYSAKHKSEDKDGPENFHVVLLDNKRSELLATEFEPMLRCIKCGACMNHCPVYQSIGGHAYDAVYPGPMGSVLTPLLRGNPEDFTLPNASTFCGRCEEVCPVEIPLPELLRSLRNQENERLKKGFPANLAIKFFMWLSRYPKLYALLTGLGITILTLLANGHGSIKGLSGIFSGWTKHRNLPAPQGNTFQKQWSAQQSKKAEALNKEAQDKEARDE